MGRVVTNNGKSELKYTVRYKAQLISPSENDFFITFDIMNPFYKRLTKKKYSIKFK